MTPKLLNPRNISTKGRWKPKYVEISAVSRNKIPKAVQKSLKNTYSGKNIFIFLQGRADISNYLRNFDKSNGTGKCKSCATRVYWSRKCLASHKRASCPNISAEELELFTVTKRSKDVDEVSGLVIIPFDKYWIIFNDFMVLILQPTFQISDYLSNFDKRTGKGNCRSCSLDVSWNRANLSSHKRATCASATSEEKEFFTTRQRSFVIILLSSQLITF